MRLLTIAEGGTCIIWRQRKVSDRAEGRRAGAWKGCADLQYTMEEAKDRRERRL